MEEPEDDSRNRESEYHESKEHGINVLQLPKSGKSGLKQFQDGQCDEHERDVHTMLQSEEP